MKSLAGGAPNASDSGGTGGADDVTLTSAQSGVPAHTHGILRVIATNVNTGGGSNNITTGGTSGANATQNASSSHENRPAFQQAIYVIRF